MRLHGDWDNLDQLIQQITDKWPQCNQQQAQVYIDCDIFKRLVEEMTSSPRYVGPRSISEVGFITIHGQALIRPFVMPTNRLTALIKYGASEEQWLKAQEDNV